MRFLLLGASGRVGKLLLEKALTRGHEVTALVREPSRVEGFCSRVSLVRGDALHPDAVENALPGQEAVAYVLGSGGPGRTSLFSESTRILLPLMEKHGVRRLVAITGVGAGETKGHGGFLYDRILFPLFTRHIYADKDKQEAMIRASNLDWTIVRPAAFLKGAREPLQAVTDVRGVTLRKIAREEVAQFVLDELEKGRYRRQAVFIGHER